MARAVRVLVISPYHGGSHAAWAEGLRSHSRHEVTLLTLPDRFWKWRMHGGAATLARRFLRDGLRPDVIVATDMLDLSTFLALTRAVTAAVPALLYMHENQLTYPLPDDPDTGPMRRQRGERDQHYAFVNYASMLAADRVAFNSRFHRDAWFDELPRFLRHFPEHKELASVQRLRARSMVLPVGIELEARGSGTATMTAAPGATPASAGRAERSRDATEAQQGKTRPPLLLWNQRWEYDKNPAQLLQALRDVAARGAPFRLALCGQSFSESPAELDTLRRELGERVVHFGYAAPARYHDLLRQADVTISTAEHEFFGIAVLEAMAHGAFAVLPQRLSYPELLAHETVSDATRERVFYRTHEGLVDRLEWALRNGDRARRCAAQLAAAARRFAWPEVVAAYDDLFAALAGGAARADRG